VHPQPKKEYFAFFDLDLRIKPIDKVKMNQQFIPRSKVKRYCPAGQTGPNSSWSTKVPEERSGIPTAAGAVDDLISTEQLI